MTNHEEVDGSSVFQSHSHPIKLSHHKENLEGRNDREVFNDFGFVFRGQSDDGEDIHLWTFMYRQSGNEIIIDGEVCQTLFIHGKFPEGEVGLVDRPYINKGQNIEDYFPIGSMKIEENAESITWHLGGREFVAMPPHFEVKGTHAGVTCRLNVTGGGPGYFHAGSFEELVGHGAAGYISHATAEGEIEADGKLFRVKGYIVHERVVQTGVVPDRISYMNGRGLNWFHGWGPEFSFFLMYGGRGLGTSMCNIEGQQFTAADPNQLFMEELTHWIDPLSAQVMPYRWRIRVHYAEGVLEATVNSLSRAYYTWIRRGGTLVVNQHMARGDARFTFNDGRVVTSQQLSLNEHMRTLYNQPTR